MSTAYDRLIESEDGRRELCIEQTITNVTELICRHLDDSGMSRTDLARQMDVTPGRITQLLEGDANLTLRSVARALAAFGQVLSGVSEPIVRATVESEWVRRSEPCLGKINHPARAERLLAGISSEFTAFSQRA